jgi:hypothetical protein
MIVSVFRRRLREGATFEDFLRAWEADRGFGVPARVVNAIALDDPREILSIGFVGIDAGALPGAVDAVADPEAVRHSRIDDVIESTVLHAFYDLRTEHDFTADPRAVTVGSSESLFATLLRSTGG